ncbi:uncharacterized protein LOC131876825 [Tigriopus californicus]|uniref:uncharacterized protein LOC131876825 n=1 Tax=Tigriopus californicus TaxID=6832 RepID=UPI0027DA9E65|nr:uncharacterized protein LOC131876825 [Tigriopus californicus]
MSKIRSKFEEYSSSRKQKWLEFCRLTSLHGYGYLFRENKPLSHTIGWVIVIIVSLICVSILLYMNIDEFVRSSVSFNLESPTTPLSEVYFPSIVICNMNKLRKSFIFSLLRDPKLSQIPYHDLLRIIDQVFIDGRTNTTNQALSEEEGKIIDSILQSRVYDDLFQEVLSQALKPNASLGNIPIAKWHILNLVDINEDTIAEIKRSSVVEAAAQFRDEEMITQVDFAGYGAFYESRFTTDISETCVWFTPFWERPSDMHSLETVKKSVRNGANNGFQILLDAESYDYASSAAGTEGFSIAILHQLDIPIMKHSGVQIETGQSVQIAVTPSLIETTNPCKRRFTPEKRQCYFKDEINLRHFPSTLGYRYEMSNCLYEATLQKVERECGCTSAQFRYEHIQPQYPSCEAANKKCMNDLIDLMGTERTIDDEGVNKPCLAACEDQKHSLMVTSAGYPNAESFYLCPDFCLVLRKLRKSCTGDRIESLEEWDEELCSIIESSGSLGCESLQNNKATNISKANLGKIRRSVAYYAKRNMARVNIFIRDPYVQRFLTEEKITEISFVGNIGGLLGLFVGFSFISGVEFLYYFFVVGNCTRRMWKGSEKHVEPDKVINQKDTIGQWTDFPPLGKMESHTSSAQSIHVLFNNRPKLIQVKDIIPFDK